MGVGFGLIQGLTRAATGINEGKARAKELERQAKADEQRALHESLVQSLMQSQLTKMNAPPPKRPRAAHYDAERGTVVYTSEDGPAEVEQVGAPRQRTEAPRNIDPLSPQGIAAAAEREAKLAAAVPATQRRPVSAIVQKVGQNRKQISTIDRALGGLDKNPNSVGLVFSGPDGLNQRIDPKGVDVRADIGDVGSLLIHDRSGAAVTVSEAPRLKPFVPLVTDTPDAARKKLRRLKKLLEDETLFLEQTPADAEMAGGGGVVAPAGGPGDRERRALERARQKK